jgi:hypothetical protein
MPQMYHGMRTVPESTSIGVTSRPGNCADAGTPLAAPQVCRSVTPLTESSISASGTGGVPPQCRRGSSMSYTPSSSMRPLDVRFVIETGQEAPVTEPVDQAVLAIHRAVAVVAWSVESVGQFTIRNIGATLISTAAQLLEALSGSDTL